MSRTECVDLDRYVEKLAGKPIREIFAQQGELAFRELEAACLERLLRRQRCTIALGGGTLSHPRSLQLAQELGCIVLLTAPVEVIAQRLFAERESRPLLADCQSESELKERLSQLWKERESSYAEADLILETTHSSVDTLKIELSWLEHQLLKEQIAWTSEAGEVPLHRVLPLADPDYRSPREQRSGRDISDKMERLLKAQRQKDRGEKRSKRDKKDQPAGRSDHGARAVTRPQGTAADASSDGAEVKGPSQKTQRQGSPAPRGQAPRPGKAGNRTEGPTPRTEGPTPRTEGPTPRTEGPTPRTEGPTPRTEGPTPRTEGPTPRTEGPTPLTEGPTPRTEGPTPRAASSASTSPAPVARDSRQSRQNSGGAQKSDGERNRPENSQERPADKKPWDGE
jgi:shikimate kinase